MKNNYRKILFLGNISVFKDYFKKLNMQNYNINSTTQLSENLSAADLNSYSTVILDLGILKNQSYFYNK